MLQLRQPSSVGSMAMTRSLFGASPYGNVMTPDTLRALTTKDLATFHKSAWKPGASVLVIAGDITPEAGFKLAEAAFGGWAGAVGGATTKPSTVSKAPAPKSVVVDIPQVGQAAVLLGRVGPSRLSQDYVQTAVANAVLGDGYSSRLNSEIRIKRGLSYGARSGLAARKLSGPIVASAQTRNDAVPQVIDLMISEFTRLGNEPIAEKELAARKAYIIGGFGRSVETTSGIAGQYSALAQFGLPLEKLQTYSSDIAAVTAEQAGAAARIYFDPAQATLIVVGDAAKFWDDVKAKRGGMVRINIDKLKLGSATLK
jgi:zinc protease